MRGLAPSSSPFPAICEDPFMAREELEIRVTDQIIYVYRKFLIVSDNS
jgi:hypothetical protein